MAQISKAVQRVREAAVAGLTDGQLLAAFVERQDQAAFAALVNRHGPMVWGVCRRLLNHHDAEDAFQATFLVFFRKAAAIQSRNLLANWLYVVAHQVALHARRTAARRHTREKQVSAMPKPTAKETDAQIELTAILDAELSRLPDHYRAVLVLCDLEGKTRNEAARHLGCPEGTVAGHLARGRAMLARRLRRHGLGVSGGALAAVIAQNASAVPPSVVSSTIATIAAQAIPAKVAFLAERVIKAMLVTKLKKTLAIVLLLGLTMTSAGVLTGQDDKKPAAKKAVEPQAPQEKEPFTAWGKVVGGLQAGLSVRPDRKVYHHGDTITLVVRVRNVSKDTLKFKYIRQFLDERPPTVTDADGKDIRQYGVDVLGIHFPVDVTLEPGKEIELESRMAGGPNRAGAPGFRYELRPAKSGGEPTTKEKPVFVGTGKVTLQYTQVIGNSSSGRMELDPVLSKLATGKLELQVQDAETTAWGGMVGGLQAGLSIRRKQNVYHFGDTLTLSLRVRNVSKETVKFEYLRQYLDEQPPTVTIDGNTLSQGRSAILGEHVPVQVSLEPGKEIELQSRLHGSNLKYQLVPAEASGGNSSPPGVKDAKVSIQYTRVFGDSSSGQIWLDPALRKLATGKLELQVKPAAPEKK